MNQKYLIWFIHFLLLSLQDNKLLQMPRSEFLIKKDNGFTSKYGTSLNVASPNVIYLKTKAKVNVLKYESDYAPFVNKSIKDITRKVGEIIKDNNKFQNQYLFNIDMSNKAVKFGKTSLIRYEAYLRPNVISKLTSYKNDMNDLATQIDETIGNVLYENGFVYMPK